MPKAARVPLGRIRKKSSFPLELGDQFSPIGWAADEIQQSAKFLAA
jgi:hypothetical protein